MIGVVTTLSTNLFRTFIIKRFMTVFFQTDIEEVKKIFKPEFINRIDEMLVFHTLTQENIQEIVRLMLASLNKRLEAQMGITLEVSKKVVEYIAKSGFDKNYGARPIRRSIQSKIEDALADKVLSGEIMPGDKVFADCNTPEGEEETQNSEVSTPVNAPVVTSIRVETKDIDYGLPETLTPFDYTSWLYKQYGINQ